MVHAFFISHLRNTWYIGKKYLFQKNARVVHDKQNFPQKRIILDPMEWVERRENIRLFYLWFLT